MELDRAKLQAAIAEAEKAGDSTRLSELLEAKAKLVKELAKLKRS